jgi:hypothetical protein
LLFTACVVPPVVFHDGLPAQVAGPGELAVRGGLNAMYWSEDRGSPVVPGYLTFGARMGGDVGPVSVEGGAGLMGVTVPYFHLGLGLSRPAVKLRGSAFSDGWWQASLLGGPPRKSTGFNWSVGFGASTLGFGPNLLLENRWGPVTVRGQGSLTWRASWADTMVRGTVVSIGIVAEPHIDLTRLAKPDTTQPKPR